MKKYSDFLHNQNRFSLMKKISVFLLFCLAILRGPQISAQTCDSVRFTINLSTCGVATLSYVNSGTITYTFSLDNVVSTTNTWQNVSRGAHTLTYTGSNGCVSVRNNVWLYPNISISLEQQPLRTCADTIYSFKIKVSGGQAPFTFKVDNGQQTTDSIAFMREGGHYISLIDGLGCRIDSLYTYAYYRRDSVAATTTFTPNIRCGDSTGTLRISVNSPNIARPFTISVNDRPFTSDTIFPNITNYGYFRYVVRSAQGCLYYGRTVYYDANRLKVSIYDTCANRLGRGNLRTYVSGGLAPYKFEWSNGVLSANLNDVRIGTYTVLVTDANSCQVQSQVTLTTCVWSGDTDTSGVVNANDLLNIGLAFGERGASRPYCGQDTATVRCTAWLPNNFSFWSKQTATGVNFKHIDADGNGVINHKDTLAITYNWLKTRNLRGNGNPLEIRAAAPPIFVQTGRVVEGQWASFPIMLGDVANAANGIYGLAFSINYDASVIDASTVYLTYNQNWLGSGDNVVRISKNFNGSIEAAVSRTNQQNASGNGQIATLNFKMKTGTTGRNLAFSIDNQQVINKDAQTIPVVPTPTSTSILSSTAEPDWARQIEVFPNPTTGNVNIEGQNLEIKSVEVFDISGKSLFKSENVGKKGPLSIEHAGTYFLKILTEKGVIMRKVVKI
jgi:Secretion system C-terminal sorting domain